MANSEYKLLNIHSPTFWTFVIAMATLMNILISYCLWRTATDSVDTTREIFESSHRPILIFRYVTLAKDHDSPNILNFSYRLKNVSDLPARDIKVYCGLEFNNTFIDSTLFSSMSTLLSTDDVGNNGDLFIDSIIGKEFIQGTNRADMTNFIIWIEYKGSTDKKFNTFYKIRYSRESSSFVHKEQVWE